MNCLSNCVVCMEVTKSCESLYKIVLNRYLPKVIEYVCGVQHSDGLYEADAQICAECTKALIQAEDIIKKFHESQELQRQTRSAIKEDAITEEIISNLIEYVSEQEEYVGDHGDAGEMSEDEDYNSESSAKANSSNKSKKSQRRATRTQFHFRCEECPYDTEFATYFREHMIKTHGVEKPRIFKCDHCTEAYVEHRTLRDHIAHVHELKPRNNKFLCSECGKGFGKECHLVRHSYVHNPAARPFHCDYCPMLFVSQSSAKRHMVASHSEIKSFACEVCGKAFGVIYDLKAHLKRVHSPKGHACPKCGQVFRFSKRLVHHMHSDCEQQ